MTSLIVSVVAVIVVGGARSPRCCSATSRSSASTSRAARRSIAAAARATATTTSLVRPSRSSATESTPRRGRAGDHPQGNTIVVNLPGVKDQDRRHRARRPTGKVRFRPVLSRAPSPSRRSSAPPPARTTAGHDDVDHGRQRGHARRRRPRPRRHAVAGPPSAGHATAAGGRHDAHRPRDRHPATPTTTPPHDDRRPRRSTHGRDDRHADPTVTDRRRSTPPHGQDCPKPWCCRARRRHCHRRPGLRYAARCSAATAPAPTLVNGEWVVDVSCRAASDGLDAWNTWPRSASTGPADVPDRRHGDRARRHGHRPRPTVNAPTLQRQRCRSRGSASRRPRPRTWPACSGTARCRSSSSRRPSRPCRPRSARTRCGPASSPASSASSWCCCFMILYYRASAVVVVGRPGRLGGCCSGRHLVPVARRRAGAHAGRRHRHHRVDRRHRRLLRRVLRAAEGRGPRGQVAAGLGASAASTARGARSWPPTSCRSSAPACCGTSRSARCGASPSSSASPPSSTCRRLLLHPPGGDPARPGRRATGRPDVLGVHVRRARARRGAGVTTRRRRHDRLPRRAAPARGAASWHRLYHGETDFDFVGKRRIGFTISGVLIVHHRRVAHLPRAQPRHRLRGRCGLGVPANEPDRRRRPRRCSSDNGIDGADAKIQTLARPDGGDIRIQVGDQPDEVRGRGQARPSPRPPASTAEDVSVNVGEPDVGRADHQEGAHRALVVFFLLIAIYISIRFEWRMAVAALVAVLHDVLISVGIYSVFGFEVTPATVIAFLTILGFSLYDTIVVFDKVHENSAACGQHRAPYGDIVNLSMNQVLMRSINTSLAAVLPVLSLLVVGSWLMGAIALQDFALALLVGLITGSYSSIFIATPILAMLKEREPRYAAPRGRARGGRARAARRSAASTAPARRAGVATSRRRATPVGRARRPPPTPPPVDGRPPLTHPPRPAQEAPPLTRRAERYHWRAGSGGILGDGDRCRCRWLRDHIRDIPDYPQPGVTFRDITPLLGDPDAFRFADRRDRRPLLRRRHRPRARHRGPRLHPRRAGGLPARRRRSCPCARPASCPGRWPGRSTCSSTAPTSSRSTATRIHPGERVLIVDDVLATGGTAAAACAAGRGAGGGGRRPRLRCIELGPLGGRATPRRAARSRACARVLEELPWPPSTGSCPGAATPSAGRRDRAGGRRLPPAPSEGARSRTIVRAYEVAAEAHEHQCR